MRKLIKKIKSPIKKGLLRFARSHRGFDNWYASIIRRKRQRTFDRYAELPINDKLIVFESFMGRKYADSPKVLYENMLKDDDFTDCRFVWFIREKEWDKYAWLADNPRTEIVAWGSDEYYKTYAQASVWIANTRIPESITKRSGQTYLQCWHGTPLKKLGVDVPAAADELEITRRVVRKDASRYTYLISPSKYFSEKLRSALDLDAIGKADVIRETGYPRNDSIVNHTAEDEARIKADLGISPKSKVILYAPTYREDNRGSVYEHHEALDFDSFISALPDDYVVLFRAHYYIAKSFDFEKHRGRVIDASGYPEVNELYIISDLLITDYSSVFFDYGILGRPLVFYMHDLDHYKDELRGLYLDLEELPGPVVTTQEELTDTILSAGEWFESDEQQHRMEDFRKRFAYLEDGKSAERVLELMKGFRQ